MTRVLVVEKEGEFRKLIDRKFGGCLAVESVSSLQAAWETLKQDKFHLVVWDTHSDPASSYSVVKTIKKFSRHAPQVKTIIVSDLKEPENISDRDLKCQWLQEPLDKAEFYALIETDLRSSREPDLRNRLTNPELDVPTEFEGILAISLSMRSVLQQIVEAAAEDIPVLITGETGTGKDLVAAAIHKKSKRKEFPYLPVNMGAIATELIASELFGHERGAYTGASEARAGFFEQAQGGIIFLDEITTMDEKTQVSLLRVLETKTIRRVRAERDIKVNVRVIAATNENIEEAVKTGRFREDLYYRLDVFRIHLPPLRERPGGVTLLTDHYVSRFDELYKRNIRVVSSETYRLLRRYTWPGNVRELKNVIQRAVLLAKGAELTPDLLPARIRENAEGNGKAVQPQYPIQLGMCLADVEKEFIKMTLSSVSGNKMKAASILGISRRALYNKLKRHGLL
jgi:DNA-binding NtrC family response regulator